MCKYNNSNIDFKQETNYQSHINEFWGKHKRYKTNNNSLISIYECKACHLIMCHTCIELGYDFSLNFTQFKVILNEETLYKKCGGCHLEKWNAEAISRTQKWVK